MPSRVGVNLRASAYLHQGDRKYMEDEFQVAYQRTQDKKDIEYAFFGIFDGHGGKEAAHFAKDNLMDNIVSQRLFWSENDDDVLCAIKEGFMQTHMAMWKELDQWPRTASGWPSTSGTTASIAFIRRQKIYIGHVGDSGIVLGYEDGNSEWVGVSLTKDHKPESSSEMNRITECGGKVIAKSGVPRVVWNRPKSGHQGPVRRSTPMDEIPFLAVARSLGDLWSYNASHNEFVVSPEPDVCVVDIDVANYRCLIFGTDGLWNALSPSFAVAIAYNSEKNNEKHFLGLPLESGKPRIWLNPSRCIVTGALERYQRVGIRADNTSAVTVFLDPPGRPKREVLQQQLANSKSCNLSPKNTPPLKSLSNRKPKEISAQVHVYNQNSVGGEAPHHGSLMILKERLPHSSNDSTLLSKLESNRPSSTTSFGNKSDCPDCGCATNLGCSRNHDNSLASSSNIKEVSNSQETKKSSRSCCCSHRSGGSVTCQTNSNVDSNSHGSKPLASKVPNDLIQIPLISSSSCSTSTGDEDSNEGGTKKLTTSVPKSKPEITSSAHSESPVLTSPRRTRSFFSLPVKDQDCEKSFSDSSPRGHQSILLTPTATTSSLASPSVADRVLKSVNCNSLPVPSTTPKRKRSRDLQQEERCSKSLRVSTRAHYLRHKPMVTRSQGKGSKQRKPN